MYQWNGGEENVGKGIFNPVIPNPASSQAKLSDTQVLIMGGVTRIPDSTKAEALSDCWLMHVYNKHVQWTQINIDSGMDLRWRGCAFICGFNCQNLH